MIITALPWGNRIDLKEDSDLEKAREIFDKHKYTVCFTPLTEINKKDYFKEFLKYFGDLSELNILGYGNSVNYNFLYEMPNLTALNIHVLYPINFEYLSQLKNLSLWWNKKMISNFDKLQNLEHLSITEFDEKDLTKLSTLTNLKSLSFKTAKIKSLKGIETLKNLRVLSLGGVRSLTDITDIQHLQKLKHLEFDICWKLQDFSPIGKLQELEVLELLDCKNLSDIQFVRQMPNLKQLSTLGTTIINDCDTTPAEHVPVFFGSQHKKYNKQYPEKEIKEKVIGASRFLK